MRLDVKPDVRLVFFETKIIKMNSKKPKLFLVPFAGGNCYSFQFLMPHLSAYDVVNLELPGRGMRMTEPLIQNFEQAAQDIYKQVKKNLGTEPFFFYGHSLGTYIILRVTQMLESENLHPKCLILTGNAGPGTDHRKDRHLLEKEDFKNELRKLGGFPEELMENEEMLAFFEPVLRSDFQIVSDCDLQGSTKVQAPIYAMMGSEESLSPQLDNWGNYTEGRFEHEILKGDHFFIHKHPQKLGSVIKSFYDQSKVPQTI